MPDGLSQYHGAQLLTPSPVLQVIRFIPALIVTEGQMDHAISIIRSSIEEVALEG